MWLFQFFWYGVGGVSVYAEKNAGDNKYIDDHPDDSYDYNFGVLTTIFVMALIELFLCILGTVASQDSPPNAQVNFINPIYVHYLKMKFLNDGSKF